MNKLLILALITIGMLTGCNNKMSAVESSLDSSTNESLGVTPQPESQAQKMLADLEATLKANSQSTGLSKVQSKLNLPMLNLDPTQISTIMGFASGAVGNAGLTHSNDMSAILPVLIGGASQGVGSLNLPTGQVSSLMGLIGNGSLGSLLNMSGSLGGTNGAIPTDMISLLSGSLFQNLPTAGIPTSGLPNASGSLMALLTGGLGSTGFGTNGLSSIISSLSSGAVGGIGGIQVPGMNSSLLSSIFGQLGSGSVTGIGGISLPGGMNNNILQTLLGSVTSGANMGLGNIGLGNIGGGLMGGNLFSSLLGNLTQGQTGALPGLGLGLGQTNGIAGFLQLFLGNLGQTQGAN